MDPNRILSLARRIVTQCIRDRRTFALIIIVPSLVMALLGYFYTAGNSTGITIGVADADKGMGNVTLSGAVLDQLKNEQNLTLVSLSAAEVNQSIKDKKIDGAIVFGESFTRDTLINKRISLDIVTEGTDQAKTAMIGAKLHNATIAAVSSAAGKGGLSFETDISKSVIYGDGYTMLDLFAPYLLGIIAFVFIFIFTTVTFLRERTFGTFERLLVSPVTRSELIVGYVIGFSVFAIIQSAIILAFALFVLKVKIAGDIYSVVTLQLLLTVVSVNLGILCSSFARNELQAVQFIPLLILPQVFLDGMFWPISTLPDYLQVFSYLMPLTYANDALQNIMVRGTGLGAVWLDVGVLVLFALVTIVLSSLSVSRQVGQQ
jgi:ABC-2 type transport system permease protein